MKKLFLMRNSKGEHDGTWTCALISFLVVTVIVIVSMFDSLTIGGSTVLFSEPNLPLITLYFGGSFTSYIVRKYQKKDTEAPGIVPEETK